MGGTPASVTQARLPLGAASSPDPRGSRTLLPGVEQEGLTTPVSPQPWAQCLGQGRSWGVTGPSADTRLPPDPRRHSRAARRLLPLHWIPPHLRRQGSLILPAPRSPKAPLVNPEAATASPLPTCPFLGQIFPCFMNYLILFFCSFPTSF